MGGVQRYTAVLFVLFLALGHCQEPPAQCGSFVSYLSSANRTETALPGGQPMPPSFPRDPAGSERLPPGGAPGIVQVLASQSAALNMTQEALLSAMGLSFSELDAAPEPAAIDVLLESVRSLVLARERQLHVTTPSCDLACEREQRAALIALYSALDGPQWTFPPGTAPWPVNGSGSGSYTPYSHCSWHGVACCTASHTISYQVSGPNRIPLGPSLIDFDVLCAQAGGVVGLQLPNLGLTGTVPDSVLRSLGSLEYINFQSNRISGPMGGGWDDLHYLKVLMLSNNQMTGSLPEIWSSFPHMRLINLARNHFSGPLPRTVSSMPLLTTLVLDQNQFSGTVPVEWAQLPSIQEVSMDDNRLEGHGLVMQQPHIVSRPGYVGLYSMRRYMLRSYSIRNNRFRDLADPSFLDQLGVLPLEVLDAGFNDLEGPLPTEIVSNPLLRTLQLDHNRYSGELPPRLFRWGLETLRLESNLLSGPLPESVGSATTLQRLNVANNSALVGPLPASMSRLPQMEELDVRWTSLQTLPGQFNSRGELLPEFLAFDRLNVRPVIGPDGSFANMRCFQVVGVPHSPWSQTSIMVSPWLFYYQDCNCSDGYKPVWVPAVSASNVVPSDAPGALAQELSCVPAQPSSDKHLLPAILVPVLTFLALLAGGLFLFFRHRGAFAKNRAEQAKTRGPPGAGKPVTLVLTDVEGSTELWEHFPQVMSEALDLQEKAMRKLIGFYRGYEVSTEGDSFLVAFHEPSDALAWCLAVQHGMLFLPWPAQLLTHPKAAEAREGDPACRLPSAPSTTSKGAVPRSESDLRGYRAEHEALRRYDRWWRPASMDSCQSGSFWSRLRSRLSLGSSGRLKSRARSADSREDSYNQEEAVWRGADPPTSALQGTAGREPGGPPSPPGSPWPSSEPKGSTLPDLGTVSVPGVPASIPSFQQATPLPAASAAPLLSTLNSGKPSAAPNLGAVPESASEGQDGSGVSELLSSRPVLFRGLRTRMGLATGVPHHVSRHRVTQRREYFGDVVWRVQTVSDMGHGGQVLMDEETFEGLHGRMDAVFRAVVDVMGSPFELHPHIPYSTPKQALDALKEQNAGSQPPSHSGGEGSRRGPPPAGESPSETSGLSFNSPEGSVQSLAGEPQNVPLHVQSLNEASLESEQLGLARRLASTPGRMERPRLSRGLSSPAAARSPPGQEPTRVAYGQSPTSGDASDLEGFTRTAGPDESQKTNGVLVSVRVEQPGPADGWLDAGRGSSDAAARPKTSRLSFMRSLFTRSKSASNADVVGGSEAKARSDGREKGGAYSKGHAKAHPETWAEIQSNQNKGSAIGRFLSAILPRAARSDSSNPHASGGSSNKTTKSPVFLARIMALDQGEHAVDTESTSRRLHVYEALYVGLEERARVFPPIDSTAVISPGYLDAPSARYAPLKQICRHLSDPSLCPLCAPELPPIPPITVVFCAPNGLAELRAWDRSVADKAQATWRSAIRRLLADCGGYEAQEADGAFLLAFRCPAAAIRWCLMTQWKLMLLPWPKALLSHPLGLEEWEEVDVSRRGSFDGNRGGTEAGLSQTREASVGGASASPSNQAPLPLSPSLTEAQAAGLMPLANAMPEVQCEGGTTAARRRLLFRGLRARMGMYEGVPARIRPHLSTGRADYFGPLVNRAARIAYAVAAPGQILAELNLAVHAVEVFREHGARCKLDASRESSAGQGAFEALQNQQSKSQLTCAQSTVTVEISDVGLYALKGVVGQWRLAQINCSGLSGRSFRGYLPKRKGTKLEEGTGRVAQVMYDVRR